jgi:truncated hemoglobin YjbI
MTATACIPVSSYISIVMSREFLPNDVEDNSLIARLGGASDFDFVIMELCGMIEGDAELKKIFKSLGKKGLVSLQRKVLTLIFGSSEEDDNNGADDDNVKQRILLMHYSLFQNGMNEKHFDTLSVLFQQALESAWVDAALIEEFMTALKKYRKLFEIKQRQSLNLASYEEVEQENAKTKQKRHHFAEKKKKKAPEMRREEEGI